MKTVVFIIRRKFLFLYYLKRYKREHPESQLVEISPSDRVSRNAYASVSKSRNVCPSVSGSVLSTSQLNTYTTPTDSSENVYWEIGEVYSQPKNIEKLQLYHKHYNGINWRIHLERVVG